MPNFLRQVLQTYSEETLIFLCTIKNSPPKAVGKDWSQKDR